MLNKILVSANFPLKWNSLTISILSYQVLSAPRPRHGVIVYKHCVAQKIFSGRSCYVCIVHMKVRLATLDLCLLICLHVGWTYNSALCE